MTLDSIYAPIQADIGGVKDELNQLVGTFEFPATAEVVAHFAKVPGKFLRPALLLLSAKAVVPQPTEALRRVLIRAGTGVELIHDASLVHDDILDRDTERRGQPTVNALWGDKVALLTGDVLYSRAFGILVGILPTDLLLRVVQLNETMCSAEIEQARTLGQTLTRDQYYRIIQGKTAAFMSVCCRLGASLVGGTGAQVEAMAGFGLAFGLAFQLFDDRADGDLGCPEVDCLVEGRAQAARARGLLASFSKNSARTKLEELVDHLVKANSANPDKIRRS